MTPDLSANSDEDGKVQSKVITECNGGNNTNRHLLLSPSYLQLLSLQRRLPAHL